MELLNTKLKKASFLFRFLNCDPCIFIRSKGKTFYMKSTKMRLYKCTDAR